MNSSAKYGLNLLIIDMIPYLISKYPFYPQIVDFKVLLLILVLRVRKSC